MSTVVHYLFELINKCKDSMKQCRISSGLEVKHCLFLQAKQQGQTLQRYIICAHNKMSTELNPLIWSKKQYRKIEMIMVYFWNEVSPEMYSKW